MTEAKFKVCDNPLCKSIIPTGSYYINVADAAMLKDVADAEVATLGEDKVFCSIKCVTEALEYLADDKNISVSCPVECPGRGPEADTCLDCPVTHKLR